MDDNIFLSSLFFLLLSLILAVNGLFLRKKTNPARNLPPTPSGRLPIIGHLHLLKEPLHRTLLYLSQKHGPVFSLQLGSRLMVVVSSASVAAECFTRNDVVLANRPKFIAGKYFAYNFSSIGNAPYGDHWRNLRRLAAVETLSASRLNLSSAIRQEEIEALLRRLYRVSASDFAQVELKSAFSELTLNIMMRTIVGKTQFGDRRFKELIQEMFELAVSSYPGDFLPFLNLVDYSGYLNRVKTLGRKLDALWQFLIDDYRKNKSELGTEDINTMIGHLVSLQQLQPEYYTDEMIKGHIMSMLAAGTDTSAVTLEWSLSNLLNHPEVLKKATEEIDAQINSDRLVEESDLPKLQYLKSVISETLRLYPAAPLLVPHEASAGCNIGGFDVPNGAILIANAWAIHRDPTVWDDPTCFNPERFRGVEDDSSGKMLPFGLGRRACPGMRLAGRVLGVALGSLLRCFEWKKVSEEEIDMGEGHGLTMPKLQPLVAMCKRRPIAHMLLGT
uniref:Cytochrome P450 CYP82-1 n=1 Tax=Daphne genkwa TaxID=1477590 RepID=A0A977Q558_9ROSI|nr:cytochrome P450 CYP82-1 [Daphne genkwa]